MRHVNDSRESYLNEAGVLLLIQNQELNLQQGNDDVHSCKTPNLKSQSSAKKER